MTHHCLTEHHTILELLWGDGAIGWTLVIVGCIIRTLGIATEVRMALWTKPIERATHVEFLLRLHVEERQIKCRATCVTTSFAACQEMLVIISFELYLHRNIFCYLYFFLDRLSNRHNFAPDLQNQGYASA